MSNEQTVTVNVTINARRDDVFMALTDSDLIRKWSGEEAVVGRTVGGEFSMFNRWVTGRVLDFKPPRLVSFSWQVSEWPEGSPESQVVIALEEREGRTLVTLTHDGFPNAEEAESHRTGWMEQVFDPLRKFLETGETVGAGKVAGEKAAEQEGEREKTASVEKSGRGKATRRRSVKKSKAKKKASKRKPVKNRAAKKTPVKKKARTQK